VNNPKHIILFSKEEYIYYKVLLFSLIAKWIETFQITGELHGEK